MVRGANLGLDATHFLIEREELCSLRVGREEQDLGFLHRALLLGLKLPRQFLYSFGLLSGRPRTPVLSKRWTTRLLSEAASRTSRYGPVLRSRVRSRYGKA